MAGRAILAGTLILTVVACGGPSPSSTPGPPAPVSTPTSVAPPPTASADPVGIPLAIHGSGTVGCPLTPFGCRAAVAFLPAGVAPATTPPSLPEEGVIRFEIVKPADGDGSTWDVGPPIDPPAKLRPGDYLVMAATEIVSDVSSEAPGPTVVFPSLGDQFECSTPLTVTTTTVGVRIEAAYRADASCRLTARVS
jgi:hypothetical protein